MEWKKANNSSETKPEEIEFSSADGVYYARTNFVSKTREDEEGNEYKYWEYDETIIPEREYSELVVLKELLNKSDYLVDRTFEQVMALSNPLTFIKDMIAIMSEFKTKYTEVITNRETWRKRIEELEDK